MSEQKFTPRDTSPERAAELEKHLRFIQPNAAAVPDWREHTCYDLSSCPHTTCTIIEVENPHGVWGIEVCNDCGVQCARECPCVSSTWNEQGTILTCDNCGKDGT